MPDPWYYSATYQESEKIRWQRLYLVLYLIQCQGEVHLIKYVQNVNMHEKQLLSEYSDKYLQKQALETA